MLSALLLVGVLLLAGHFAYRTQRFPESTADVLNRFIIDICLPATILRLVPKLEFQPALATLAVAPWVIALFAYGFARGTARVLGLDRTMTTALFLVTALGNTSFLGFPMISALVGEDAIPLASVYDQLGSFLLLSLVAPVMLSALTTGSRPKPKDLLKRVVLFPPFIALLIAVLPFPLPSVVDPLLSAASTPLVALAMFSVGFKLRFATPEPFGIFAWGLVLKLLILPALSLIGCFLFGVPRDILIVVVLETAMPTMVSIGALLMSYGVVPELVAAFVGWGLVVSLITVPTWAWILFQLFP